MRVSIGIVAVALSAAVLEGCAARSESALAHRFVRQGKPALDVGGPKIEPAASLSEYMAKLRYLSTRSPARGKSFGATIEATDRELAAALLAERIVPSVDAHLRVAAEYRRLGILDSAYERFNRALQVDPHNATAYEGLARIWRDWRLPALGLTDAHRAVYYAPQSPSARNTLGTVLDALGNADAARSEYNAALSLDPAAAFALNNLCYLEFRLGRFGDARARCEAAVKLAPGMTAAHNNLALTLAAAGDLEAARREFLAAGDRAAADYNMGIVYLAKREYASAARRFEDAASGRPDFTEAKARALDALMHASSGAQ